VSEQVPVDPKQLAGLPMPDATGPKQRLGAGLDLACLGQHDSRGGLRVRFGQPGRRLVQAGDRLVADRGGAQPVSQAGRVLRRQQAADL